MASKKSDRVLSYEELIALAKKHYNEGGDGIVECWDVSTFDYWVKKCGPITQRVAMRLIRT